MNNDFDLDKYFDRYLEEDMKLYIKITNDEELYNNLYTANDICKSLHISTNVDFCKYKICLAQLFNCNCTYDDILAFRRLQIEQYRNLIVKYLNSDTIKHKYGIDNETKRHR